MAQSFILVSEPRVAAPENDLKKATGAQAPKLGKRKSHPTSIGGADSIDEAQVLRQVDQSFTFRATMDPLDILLEDEEQAKWETRRILMDICCT